jgi:hypothetical protein
MMAGGSPMRAVAVDGQRDGSHDDTRHCTQVLGLKTGNGDA